MDDNTCLSPLLLHSYIIGRYVRTKDKSGLSGSYDWGLMLLRVPLNADVQKRYPALEPKHDLFLSHSGKDKDFTGLLYERLKDCGYCPFFDSDRSVSLPPGENALVANVLFAAARQCRVLIVILSEAFFTNSEWPMLELSAFVESQREELKKSKSGNTSHAVSILPVYLGLTRDQTKDEARRERWCQQWSEMEKKEKEKAEKRTGSGKPLIDTKQWKEALQVLADQSGKYTSCEYTRASGYAGLLAEIVSAVCGRVAPRHVFPDPAVQGREPICNAINRKIEESPRTKDGVRIVGLYGMAGIGKTTFCKLLCALKYCEFEGKVCYAEFKSLDSESSIELRKEAMQKEVMRKLTHINPRDIQKIDLGRVREKKVFLALDNVKPELDSIEEARMFLDIWRNFEANVSVDNGTVVIVTAQHIDTLVRLEIERSNCLEMPELKEEVAKSLFLSYAAPNCELKPEGDEDIRYCLKQCYFSKGGTIGMHYHPLALKVLGAQLRSYGPDPRIWKENLSKDDKFNQMREKEHPIFRILRKGYDMLRNEDKLLFMDVALFNPDWRDFRLWDEPDAHGAKFFDWMSIVHHPRNLASIKEGLQVLKERAVIVDIEEVSVHELYSEFARAEIKCGAQDATHWVWCLGDAVPDILEKTPSGKCWKNVERVSLTVYHDRKGCSLCREYDDFLHKLEHEVEDEANCKAIFAFDRFFDDANGGVDGCNIFGDCMRPIEGMNWKYFSNVVVLELHIYSSLNLDLSALVQRLRSLKIFVKEGTLVGLRNLRNLGWLDLTGMHWATCAEDILGLPMLQLLRLRYWTECETHALDLHNVENCIHLQELVLENCGGLKAFPDLRRMKFIRKVFFNGCRHPTEVLGLGPQLSKLEELRLVDCKSLRRLPNLAGLVSMQVLEVSKSCFEIQEFLGLETMTRLQVLTIESVPELLELPQLAGLIALERLELIFSPKVREFPDIHHLKKLQIIKADRHLCKILQTKSIHPEITILDSLPPWPNALG